MSTASRTTGRVVLLAVLSFILAPVLVLGGPVGQAAALAAPPAPVQYPSGWITAARGATTVQGGAAAASAASTGTVLAGGTVTAAAGAAVYGFATGFVIGDGLIHVANLFRADDDQLVPVSQLLMDKITRPGDYVIETPPEGVGSWSGLPYFRVQNSQGSVQTIGIEVVSSPGPVEPHYCTPGPGSQCQAYVYSPGDVIRITYGYEDNGSLWSVQWGLEAVCRSASGVERFAGMDYALDDLAPGATVTTTTDGSRVLMREGESRASGAGCRDRWTADPELIVGWRITASYYDPGTRVNVPRSAFPQVFTKPSGTGPVVDPLVQFQTRVVCDDGSLAVSATAPFRKSDGDWPMPPAARCSGATVPQRIEVWEITPNGERPDERLSEWVRPELPDPGGVANPTLDLLRKHPGTSAVSCFSQPGACEGWYETPEPTRSERFECRYGATVLALEECRVYRPSFNPDARTPYSDPATGDVPAPSPTNPTGEPAPGPAPMPPTGTTGDLGGLLAQRFPFPELRSAATAIGQMQPTGTGCWDVTLDVPEWMGTRLPVFDTCGTDPAVTWMRENRTLTGAVVWLAFLLPLAWWAWRTYAPGSTGSA